MRVNYVRSSHLKSIVRQYNLRRYEKASFLCKKVISSERLFSYDSELINEIYYYYCLSLAREHNGNDFFKALWDSRLREEDKYFLEGFYYRINGKPEKAIEVLKKALLIRTNMPKAKRELANALIASEDYESAEKLCIENYREDDRNPYYIQPYFETVIHSYISLHKESSQGTENTEKQKHLKETMESLLESMRENRADQARQMYCCMNAEYEAYVNEDYREAFDIISKGVASIGESSIFLYLTLFDIAYRFRECSVMKKALDKIDAIVSNQRYFSNAMTIRRIRYTAMMGNKSKAIKMIRYLKNMPRGIIDKLKNEVEAI